MEHKCGICNEDPKIFELLIWGIKKPDCLLTEALDEISENKIGIS